MGHMRAGCVGRGAGSDWDGFLVWTDIRADQMHIETAFRSLTATTMDSLASFSSFLIFFFSPAS